MSGEIVVIKLGGSLFDLPDLGRRIDSLLDLVGTNRAVIVSGGGAMADVVRDWDVRHRLGDETAHRLAIRTMSVTTRFVAALSNRLRLAARLEECPAIWLENNAAVLDVAQLLLADDCPLPHTWDVTSDSIAAWIAGRIGAQRLVLAKSIDAATGDGELVDACFPEVRRMFPHVRVQWVNLRDDHARIVDWDPSIG